MQRAVNWHCPHSMRSRVHVTVGRPSVSLCVCPSVPSFAGLLLSARQAGNSDQLPHGAYAARRSIANAGSASFTADVGSWSLVTQILKRNLLQRR